jgi:uncharacterized protein
MDPQRLGILFLWLLLLGCRSPGESFGGDICRHRAAADVEIIRGEKALGTFSVALADSPESRRKGLMHCPVLAPGTGMLFVYPNAGRRVFWMKNTVIALAIIFISADDRIVSIAHGEPGSLEHIRSSADVRQVLEVNDAESRHLAVGDRVRVELNTDTDQNSSHYRP